MEAKLEQLHNKLLESDASQLGVCSLTPPEPEESGAQSPAASREADQAEAQEECGVGFGDC